VGSRRFGQLEIKRLPEQHLVLGVLEVASGKQAPLRRVLGRLRGFKVACIGEFVLEELVNGVESSLSPAPGLEDQTGEVLVLEKSLKVHPILLEQLGLGFGGDRFEQHRAVLIKIRI
jgi:hypothetical protein